MLSGILLDLQHRLLRLGFSTVLLKKVFSMKKLLITALLGGALAAGPALAQSGGLAGGSPGSPGVGGNSGTSTPNMGAAASRSVDPDMRAGAPSPGRDARSQRTTNRRGTDALSRDATSGNVRKRSGG